MARTRFKSHIGSRYTRASQGASRAQLQKQFKEGMGEILGALEEFIDDVKGFVPEVGVEALEETFGKAIEYCPEDTGDLRASAYLEAESSRNRTVIAIGFGKGGQPDYAIYVHELPRQHVEPTRYKFLQSALDEDYYMILNKIPGLIREKAGT